MTDAVFDEAKRYMAWSDVDAERLRQLEPVLAPHFTRFADHFYEVVQRHPRAHALIADDAQLRRLHRTLVDWMQSGLRGPHDAQFYARRSRIGRRHVEIGLPQEYMFTATNVLRVDYHAVIAGAVGSAAEALAAVGAVDKLFDLELVIMQHHYQHDSEQRLLEGERRAHGDKLAAMQTLSAGLAHEVRNPLNSAKLQLELLERRLRRSSEGQLLATAAVVSHEIDRLTHLLDEFLTFARPTNLTRQPCDVLPLVISVAELERVGAAARDIEVGVRGSAATADVDGDKLRQVVLNLIRNAIEAPGCRRIEIEVAPTAAGARIDVSDDGDGIAPAIRARVLEPFYSTKPDGTGLGLAIVHSLITAHGGSIAIGDVQPRGTRISIELPARGA